MKNCSDWQKNIPNYESYSAFERNELKKGMEQAYGVHLYNNWNTVKLMLLKHIKEHQTVLGTTSAIVGLDEYQGNEGNVSQIHIFLGIDKSTMGESSENYVHDLI